MAGAADQSGQPLSCASYLERAWPDVIEHQIAPFGATPFYVGIGNHEVVPPKGFPGSRPESTQPSVNGAQFTAQFADWLLAPAIKAQRLKDKDCDRPPASSAGQNEIPECLILPRNYYHWVQRGVDFIYLDNASFVLGDDQIKWLQSTLDNARNNVEVRSIVVGMHEALPHSISSDHAMCDDMRKSDKSYPASCNDGEEFYQMLLSFQKSKPVYVLASHSHYYMQGIFNTRPRAERLQGWIVGTAGAVRYSLPKASAKPDHAQTNVYGYLLGTVDRNGRIEFRFQEVKQTEVPSSTRKLYPEKLVNWCFAHNSMDLDPRAPETTTRCLAPAATPRPSPSPAK